MTRPTASSPEARRRMQANRGRNTKPELALRRELFARGLRYRVDHPVLPGSRRRADVVFTRARVVVFVDGCFWHGCPVHGTKARTNSEFWANKIDTNRRRDADTDARLRAAGWRVLRFWEHEPTTDCADVVARACRTRTLEEGRSRVLASVESA